MTGRKTVDSQDGKPNNRGKRIILLAICAICFIGAAVGLTYYITRKNSGEIVSESDTSPAAQKRRRRSVQRKLVDGFFTDLKKGNNASNFLCGGMPTKGQLKLKKWVIEQEIDIPEDEMGTKFEVKVDYTTKDGEQRTGQWLVLVTRKEENPQEYCIGIYFEVPQFKDPQK